MTSPTPALQIHTRYLPSLISAPTWIAWYGLADLIPAQYVEAATEAEAKARLTVTKGKLS